MNFTFDQNSTLLALIGRSEPLFAQDLGRYGPAMDDAIRPARFLVIGGAGSIGSAVVRELFARRPKALHVVDLSENNLAELVRDLRSSLGYIDGDFRTFALDCGSPEFDAMLAAHGPYNYVLNFSALKHVRSEKDPFTLMRMIRVNVLNTDQVALRAVEMGAKKYFCVSTDKASNPVNMMGASKRIMEMFLMRRAESIPVSTARFANVAFSDGSLPHSWRLRIAKRQPISAPDDVQRYFVTETEGAILCLMSTFLGNNRDIFFPKTSGRLHPERFSDIARRYLLSIGREPVECKTEDEARERVEELSTRGQWPCFFSGSSTTGEKALEEFYTDDEQVNLDRYTDVGVVTHDVGWDESLLNGFESGVRHMLADKRWTKPQLVDLFNKTLSRFPHRETFKYLDDRM